MADQTLPLLPNDDVDDPITPEDLGYVSQSTGGDSKALQAVRQRSRNPRELLRKVPRRISMGLLAFPFEFEQAPCPLDATSYPLEVKGPARLTPTPTSEIAAAYPETEPNTKPSPPPFPPREEPVGMQACVPDCAFGLAKPTPSRPTALSWTKHAFSSTPTWRISKPSDPILEMEARKALFLQSRRRKHPGDTMTKKKHLAAESAKNGTESASPSDSKNLAKQSTCVPLGGWREGVFLFTGIIRRHDGRYPDGRIAKVAFIKLDDPNGGPSGPGHLMNPVELGCELACFEGMNFDLRWNVQRVSVMDFRSGSPLYAEYFSNSSLTLPDHRSSFKLPSRGLANQDNFPVGLAHLPGEEGSFNTTSKSFDCWFPFACAANSSSLSGPAVAFIQGIRAGDLVTVIVCSRKNARSQCAGRLGDKMDAIEVLRVEMNIQVLSVTSFGWVNGVPSVSANPIDDIISFPTTCVLGVKYGNNWNSTFTRGPEGAQTQPLPCRA